MAIPQSRRHAPARWRSPFGRGARRPESGAVPTAHRGSVHVRLSTTAAAGRWHDDKYGLDATTSSSDYRKLPVITECQYQWARKGREGRPVNPAALAQESERTQIPWYISYRLWWLAAAEEPQQPDRHRRRHPGTMASEQTGPGPLGPDLTAVAQGAITPCVLAHAANHRRGRPPAKPSEQRQANRTGSRSPPLPGARSRGGLLLRTLLRDPREQGTNLRLTVATVSAQRPDRRQLPCFCPPRNGLRVDPEHRGDLGRR